MSKKTRTKKLRVSKARAIERSGGCQKQPRGRARRSGAATIQMAARQTLAALDTFAPGPQPAGA